jgi:hypothetical protein
MTYTIPSYTVQPGSVYQPKASGSAYVLDQIGGVVGCWSTRQLMAAGSGNIIRGRDATTNEADYTSAAYPAGIVTLANGGDAFSPALYDQSGNGNNATQTTAANQPKLVDTGTLIASNGVPVMEFDGSLSGLTAASVLSSSLSSLSVAFSCNFSSSVFGMRFLSLGINTTNRIDVSNNAGKINLIVVASGVAVSNFVGNTAINDSSSHSCVCTATTDNFKIYIDGVLEANTDTSGSFAIPSGSSLFVGSYFSTSLFYDGLLNDVMIFNKALNQSEVTQLHNALAL